MAYMSQERKAGIAEALKKVVPKDWRYSLAVRHHSTIVMTIREAPFDMVGMLSPDAWKSVTINPYHWRDNMEKRGVPEPMIKVFDQIFAALNGGNFDKSDMMSDYHHVGWYVDVEVGNWNKPFINSKLKEVA